MSKIIITDLTRFNTNEKVCIAGLDIDTGECIRPMPYLRSERCAELNILPGAILQGDFTTPPKLEVPHYEDRFYNGLTFLGPSSAEQFHAILTDDTYNDVGEGFNIELENGQKTLPATHDLKHSIITIKVNPREIQIVEDGFKKGKIKVIFSDMSGQRFSYLPITDLGFHDYAMNKHGIKKLAALNVFLHSQTEIFLRIGLGRVHQDKFWMQVNGIYTFPNYLENIRSYE